MKGLNIMSVVGSAVPQSVRDLGLLACWYVVKEGEIISRPLLSRAQACAWCERQLTA